MPAASRRSVNNDLKYVRLAVPPVLVASPPKITTLGAVFRARMVSTMGVRILVLTCLLGEPPWVSATKTKLCDWSACTGITPQMTAKTSEHVLRRNAGIAHRLL